MSRNGQASPFHSSSMGIPVVAVLLPLLLRFCSAGFVPTDNYLLNCGSNAIATFDGTDARRFLPDSSPDFDGLTFSFAGSTSLTDPNPSDSTPNVYRTARFFPTTSSYTFSIRKQGTHVVRLHFFPFSNPTHDLSTPVFNVSLSGSPLLTSFSPRSGSSADSLVLKEFFLPIDATRFSISFSSTGFVSAVEVFSAPEELLDNTPKQIMSATMTVEYHGLQGQVLETVHRINVGGAKVTPNNDTLWRTWVTDDAFLETKSLSQASFGSVDYQFDEGLGPSQEIAPYGVYSTVREINRSALNGSDSRLNLTWNLNVSSGRRYLVRMHFCDIVGKATQDVVFDSYVNGFLAFEGIDIAAQMKQQLGVPYYTDSVLDVDKAVRLRVSVRPSISTSNSLKANAILNGLEVMSMNGELVLPEAKGKGGNSAATVGAMVGGLVLVGVLAVSAVIVVRRRRRKRTRTTKTTSTTAVSSVGSEWTPLRRYRQSRGRSATDPPLPNLNLGLKIPFAGILAATKNFDSSNQIGQGGFGKVYKGVLHDGTAVAVKRGSRGWGQGRSEFYTEILVLSKIRHRHLVSLIGYCEEQSEMILVYEFMEKGTLREHLYGSTAPTRPPLSWKQRLEICIGSARGLHYLHTGSDTHGIIHRDVKSANILLDGNFVAKVADFGLSKTGPLLDQTHVSTNVKGSFGYLDPEYFKTQQLTDKSDVYSFGVVLLEVLCGRGAIDRSLPWEQQNLAEWGLRCMSKGGLGRIVDASLAGCIKPNSLRKYGETIEKCLSRHGVDRPSMADVLWNLDYALKLEQTNGSQEQVDDSVTSLSTAVIPAGTSAGVVVTTIPPVPSAGRSGDPDETSSQVFSQLMTTDGR